MVMSCTKLSSFPSCRKSKIFVFKTSGLPQQGDCRNGPHLQRMCEAPWQRGQRGQLANPLPANCPIQVCPRRAVAAPNARRSPRAPAGCASVPSARAWGQRAFIGRLLQVSCVARYTLPCPIQRKKGSSCKTYLMALLALRTKPKSRIPIRLMRFFAPNIKSRRKTTLRRLRFPRKKCRQSPNTIGAGRG